MNNRKKTLFVICSDSILVIGALLFKLLYADLMRIFPECTYASYGHPCGSCGGTRCVYQILQGNFVEAFKLNQLYFIVFCYLVVVFVLLHLSWLFKLKFAEKPLKVLANYKAVIAFGVGFFIFSIWRFFQ